MTCKQLSNAVILMDTLPLAVGEVAGVVRHHQSDLW